MSELRLGDVIDDFCIKCRRVTNHSIVSILNSEAAKVRCRTCYHDHDYRHEQAPPSKKDLKKAELFNEVLANIAPAMDGDAPAGAVEAIVDADVEVETPETVANGREPEAPAAPAPAAKKKARKTAKK